MTTIIKPSGCKTLYIDSRFQGNKDDLIQLLHQSTTLYVGNLSFYTTEEQIHELFSKCGPIRRIIMGLNRDQRTPCGFCFVEYYKRESALDCLKYINRTKLDYRTIRVDMDYGFCKDRNLGRGRSGGQVRDDYRARDEGGGFYTRPPRFYPQEGLPSLGTRSFGYGDYGHKRQKRQRSRRDNDDEYEQNAKRTHVEADAKSNEEDSEDQAGQ